MKTLILLSASPASGKTRWCTNYITEHPDAVYLNSDEIRIEITGDYNDFSKQHVVWETFAKRIEQYNELEGDFTLILDALNDLNVLRQKYVKMCDKFDKKILVVIKKPLEETLQNNANRNPEVRIPENIMINLYNKFEMPDEETLALFDEYFYIDHKF